MLHRITDVNRPKVAQFLKDRDHGAKSSWKTWLYAGNSANARVPKGNNLSTMQTISRKGPPLAEILNDHTPRPLNSAA